MDEIATKLLLTTVDPNKHGTTLTITGAGGFGKTTTVISLCHYPVVNNHFTDGFVFIELGPQATDPSIKLRDIYNLLTGEQCGINVVEQKINQLTSEYYHNLLVIIDDVWHVEDAEPLVKAFSNCKTILTTRMNDIEQYIPSKQSVNIGPMTQHEAISLLTSGIIDSSQLSQEDVGLLDELAQDVHLWPLVLSLIRGHLSHNLKQYHLSCHEAIQSVQAKLHDKGVTAFDKNNIETTSKSRKFAVKVCIEMTLELLTKSLSNRIKTLILWNGIGTSLQVSVLNDLWSVSKQEAEETVDALWAYGLVQFTNITVSPSNITQICVEVHSVISQYIIESMTSIEVLTLSPMSEKSNAGISVSAQLALAFQQSYGIRNIHDLSSLTPVDYLKYKLSEIENHLLPYSIKRINMFTTTDPHDVLPLLQDIKDALMRTPYTINLLSLFGEEIKTLTTVCKQTLKDTHKLCRKLNQSVQRYLYERNYNRVIQSVEEFIKNYPLCNVAGKGVAMVKEIIPYCDGELLHYMIMKCELFQARTLDYHFIAKYIIPCIKLDIKQHEEIVKSLSKGSPDIEMTYHYCISGKYDEERELVHDNYYIQLQEVAPNYVQQRSIYYASLHTN